MGKKVYTKTALTGGGDTALDGIDGSLLNNLDIGIVTVGGTVYFYVLDHDNSGSESSPSLICPDRNYGTKRWILQVTVPGPGLSDVALTDYSATSTIVGWSAYTTKTILYHKIGTLVWCFFNIDGTSDNAATTFTLPYTSNSSILFMNECRCRDNGGAGVTGIIQVSASDTLTVYPAIAGGAWTASGQKYICGQICYEVA
jgi:hypothetical protein